MEVERTKLRHGPHNFRQHAEADHHKKIGPEGPEGFKEFLVLELFRLQHGKTFLHGVLFYGAFLHLEAAAGGFVRNGDNSNHLVTLLAEGIKRTHGEFRGAHIHYPCLSEHSDNLTLNLSESNHETVPVEQVLVSNGLYGKEASYWRKYKGRYEFSYEGRCCTIAGKPFSGDVYDPVQHEEQQGNDRRGTQAALLEDGSNRGAYEEQQQAGQRLGILLPHLYVVAVDEVDVVVGVVDLAAGYVLILPCHLQGPFKGLLPVFERLEIFLFGEVHHHCSLLPPACVQLLFVIQAIVPLEVLHVLYGALVNKVHKGIMTVL